MLKVDDKSCERLIRTQYEFDGRVSIAQVEKSADRGASTQILYEVKRSRPAGPKLDIKVRCILFGPGNSIRIKEEPDA